MVAVYASISAALLLLTLPTTTRAQLLATLSGHSRAVTAVAHSPDGKWIASGSWDNTIRIWDALTHQPVATLEGHAGAITSVVYSPDGRHLVSGSRDHSVIVWDTGTHQAIATIDGHAGPVTSVAYDPLGKFIVSGSEDQSIKIWDGKTRELVNMLSGHSGIVYTVACSPDGKTIISGVWDGAVNIWNAKTSRLKKTLSGQLSVVHTVAFTPDGNFIIGGRGDGTINIWNARNYALVQTLKGHSGTVTAVRAHPGGEFIISGHGDGSINIWNARTFQLSKTLNGHAGTVTSVSLSPDGEDIVSGSGDYLVGIWDFFPMVANLRHPPNLFAEISFADDDDNGILDADEGANLHLKLENRGRGDALNLKLTMTLAEENPHLLFENRSLRHLKAGDSRSFDIPLAAGLEVATQANALKIEVIEQQGHHVDPVEVAFSTQKLKAPGFVLLGVEIDDDDLGASFSRKPDGAVQPGEQIEARVSIQNQGGKEDPGDAQGVEVELINRSELIHIHSETSFFRERLKLGEVLAFNVVFAVNKTYPPSERLLPLELNIREKYGRASVENLSLGIELEKKTRADPPALITPKPGRLGRAKFGRLGSKTTVVFASPDKFELEDVPPTKVKRTNTLALAIGMPGIENAIDNASLMAIYFERVFGIPAADIKVYSQGMDRNDFVTLFEQKIANAVDAGTDLYVYYSGGGLVDPGGVGYLLPLDGSRSPGLAAQTCYPLSALYAAVDAFPTKSKTIILDVRVPTEEVKGTPFSSVVAADSSAAVTVISYASGSRTGAAAAESDYGLFAHHFAVGLRGNADADDDGRVRLAEIRDHVQLSVAAENSGAPVPEFWTSDGDYDKVFADVRPR